MSIDSTWKKPRELMGADRWRILAQITLPLVLPALLSGFIMTFSKVMGTFAVLTSWAHRSILCGLHMLRAAWRLETGADASYWRSS